MTRHRALPPRNRFPLPALGAALTLALLPATDAMAAKWTALNKDKAASIEIDTSSIERNGNKVSAWHRETYSPRRMQEAWAFSYASVKQLTEFQCDKRLATVVRRIYFAENGSELKSEGFDSKDATPVVPDTPIDAVFAQACRKPAPKPEPAPVAKPEPIVTEPVKPARKGSKEPPPPPPPPPKPAAPWAYEGKLGPTHWGKLDTDYSLCGSGKRQSPIDIRNSIRADLPPIRIAYQPVPLTLTDDGHGIQADAGNGGMITVDGEEFELKSFRFHRPGEEMVNGKRSAMSVVFEHQAKSGRIAMLSVPLQEGKEHRLVRMLWTALPLEQGKPASPAGVKIDPGQLLPQKRDFYAFSGSLTTPPCTEGVLWLVMKQPVQLSKEQIADFGKIYKSNVRPIQPTNGRVVKESR